MKAANFARILAAALLLAGYSAWSLSTRPPRATPVPAGDVAGIPLVSTDEAGALWHDSGTLFLDVRPAFDYACGHIAGALNVPEEELAGRLPTLRERLGRAGTIVVYCKSVDCGKSLWAAVRLRNEGLAQTRIYPHGWNEWVNRGLPTIADVR